LLRRLAGPRCRRPAHAPAADGAGKGGPRQRLSLPAGRGHAGSAHRVHAGPRRPDAGAPAVGNGAGVSRSRKGTIPVVTGHAYQFGEEFARDLDAADPLRGYRERFHIPLGPDGQPCAYLCGNSLGLQPKEARDLVERELKAWARLGVEGHFKEEAPWYDYHELFRESGARLVGARPGEVVMMNSLTVNLHLMMGTFYRPAGVRTKLLIDEPAFPSDRYAVESQIRHHGLDPSEHLLTVGPRPGEHLLREEDVEKLLAERGEEVALVLFNAVNFLTGQLLD